MHLHVVASNAGFFQCNSSIYQSRIDKVACVSIWLNNVNAIRLYQMFVPFNVKQVLL